MPGACAKGCARTKSTQFRERAISSIVRGTASRNGSSQARPEEPARPPSSDPFARENLEKLEAPERINLALRTLSEATSIMDSDPERALQGFRNAIAANPREPRSYAWAVVLLYDKGRYRECRDVLNRAERQGISRSQMMANARFRALMASEGFNHRIPD